VGTEDGFVKVVAPIEDTPAARAGVKSGDLIVRIDDKPTKGMSLNDAVKMMRGKPKTPITLTISRKGETQPIVVRIVRDVIKVQSVRSKVLEPGIGYVRITQFQEHTVENLVKHLEGLAKQNALGNIVLDLRNDPGGLLHGAVGVSAAFLAPNATVVTTDGRTEDARRKYVASPEDYMRGSRDDILRHLPAAVKTAPMVVLVNAGSASASEIVAGALQDHRRAVVLGTQTFGKGSVQSILPLSHTTAISSRPRATTRRTAARSRPRALPRLPRRETRRASRRVPAARGRPDPSLSNDKGPKRDRSCPSPATRRRSRRIASRSNSDRPTTTSCRRRSNFLEGTAGSDREGARRGRCCPARPAPRLRKLNDHARWSPASRRAGHRIRTPRPTGPAPGVRAQPARRAGPPCHERRTAASLQPPHPARRNGRRRAGAPAELHRAGSSVQAASGSPAGLYLAAAGIGGSCWPTTTRSTSPTCSGRSFIARTASASRRPNPATLDARDQSGIEVEAIARRLDGDAMLEAVARADVGLDCCDNFATRQAVNRACVAPASHWCREPRSGSTGRSRSSIRVATTRRATTACFRRDRTSRRCAARRWGCSPP